MSPPGLSSPCRRGRTEPDGTRENRNQRLGTAGPVPPPPRSASPFPGAQGGRWISEGSVPGWGG